MKVGYSEKTLNKKNCRKIKKVANNWGYRSIIVLLAITISCISLATAAQVSGQVWSWGCNNHGQVGDGTNTDSTIPLKISSLDHVKAVKAGVEYALAIDREGYLWAWGRNDDGQLGDGTNLDSNVPVLVASLSDVKSLATSDRFSLALKSDGTVWAWGRNDSGQLGDGTTSASNVPVQVSNLTDVIAIAAGLEHSLALKSDGTVWAWGSNSLGALGNGTTDPSYVPVQVLSLTGVKAISAGDSFSVALKNDGTVWVWGDGRFGKLGTGTVDSHSTPVQISDFNNVTEISTSLVISSFTLALKSDGSIWGWGRSESGVLGIMESDSPTKLWEDPEFIALDAGRESCFVLRDDGTVWAWSGSSAECELGYIPSGSSRALYQVPDLSGVIQISGGGGLCLAVQGPVMEKIRSRQKNGKLKTWKIKINGANFDPLCSVYIGGDTIPWDNVVWKDNGLIVLKGGRKLRELFPKDTCVSIRIENPDGGVANSGFQRGRHGGICMQ